MKKGIIGLALSICIGLSSALVVNAEKKEDIPKKEVQTMETTRERTRAIELNTRAQNGWVKYWGDWYYIRNGFIVYDQWLKDRGNWYYLGYDGVMLSDSFYIIGNNEYYFDSSGKMKTGWIQCYYDYELRWCYADSSGALYKNRWFKQSGKWYYFDNEGLAIQNDIWHIGNKYYYFDKNSVMKSNGWISYYEGWLYADSSGALYSNRWFNQNGKWYYFDEYYMAQDQVYYINGKYYYFNNSGVMKSNGWAKFYDYSYDDYSWVYANSSGELYTNRWLKSGGTWYYFDEYRMLDDGLNYINNKPYYFDYSSGAMKTGWITDYYYDDDYYEAIYYAKSSGELVENGWYTVNNEAYYFESCEMASNRWVSGNYYVGYDGTKVTGWNYLESEYNYYSHWYCFDNNGKLIRNQYVDGYWVNGYGYSDEYGY